MTAPVDALVADGLICGVVDDETGERCLLEEEDHMLGHVWQIRAMRECQ